MDWLWLLLALVALGVAWWTPSVALMLVCLLAGLGLLLAFALGLYAKRAAPR